MGNKMADEMDGFLDDEEMLAAISPHLPNAAEQQREAEAATRAAQGAAPAKPGDAEANRQAEADPAAGEANATPAADPEAGEPNDRDTPNFRALRKSVEDVKKERNDHKGRADKAEGALEAQRLEMENLRRELEAARKPQPAQAERAASQESPQIPNPVTDPNGYHAFIQQDMFNRSLNMSEVMLRQVIANDSDVDSKVARFKQMVSANPSLGDQLRASAHPYKFAYDTAATAMALDEIGDPAAYRTKLETEMREKLRAEWEAEQSTTNTHQEPAVRLPQSLNGARSAGGRSAAPLNIPENFDDILGLGARH